jgi:hypothetical protein
MLVVRVLIVRGLASPRSLRLAATSAKLSGLGFLLIVLLDKSNGGNLAVTVAASVAGPAALRPPGHLKLPFWLSV